MARIQDGIRQIHVIELADLIRAQQSMLLLFSDGEGLRNDFMPSYLSAAAENTDDAILFAQCNPRENPAAAACYLVGHRPVLLGLHAGEEVTRSARPWGSDVEKTLAAVREAILEADAGETEEFDPQAIDRPYPVTDYNFQSAVLDYELPVLMEFWAEWCGPCRMIAPILEKLAREYAGQLRIAKLDIETSPRVARQFNVTSLPILMAFNEGNQLFKHSGALPEPKLRQLCGQILQYS